MIGFQMKFIGAEYKIKDSEGLGKLQNLATLCLNMDSNY